MGKPISKERIAVAAEISNDVPITFKKVESVARTKLFKVNGVVTPPNLPAVRIDMNSIDKTGNAANKVKKIKPGNDQNQPSWRELLLPPLLFNIFSF